MNSSLAEFVDYVYEILDIPLDNEYDRNVLETFILTVENGEKFPINLDDVIDWLEITPQKIRITLERSYKPEIDYTKKLVTNKNGRKKYEIFISNDCFKELCLRTKSAYGELIRKYFIVVEKMYREYMVSGILNRRRADNYDYEEKGYKPSKFPLGNCVYILRIVKDSIITYKIGFTDNMNRRFAEHRRNIPGKLEIILFEMFKHHIFLESCVHSFLEDYEIPTVSTKGRNLTEIFETDIDKIKAIIEKCREFRQSPEMAFIVKKKY